MRKRLGLALLASALLVIGGCENNDDDDDNTGGDTGGNTDGGMTDGAAMSGDIFDIAGRAADSEAVVLDNTALTAQLDGLLGDGDSLEPLTIEVGNTVSDVLRSRQATMN